MVVVSLTSLVNQKNSLINNTLQPCDLLIQELLDKFEQKDLMQPILAMKSVLIKSTNRENFAQELKQVKQSVFIADLFMTDWRNI